MPDSTLAPNQYADYDEFWAAMDDHRRKAERILNHIFGSQSNDMTEALKARMWDVYAEEVRAWVAEQPEWVR